MADKKVTELVEATSAQAADVFLLVQGGVSKRITKTNLFGVLDSLNITGKSLINKTHETLSSPGSLSTTIHTSFLRNSGVGSITATLQNAEEGMTKTIACVENNGTLIVTTTYGLGFGSVSFLGVGSSITLHFIDGLWVIVGNHNVTVS
jgi:hypothetical protein